MHPPIVEFLSAPYATREDFSFIGDLIDARASQVYARAFARAGANIVLNGFGMSAPIEKERSAIETEFNVKAVYLPADMTRPAEIAEMVPQGERSFGSVDILVNNAGIQFVSPKSVGGNTMHKFFLAVILLSVSASTGALAHSGTDQEEQACTRDVQRFCRKGDLTILACLKDNRPKFSPRLPLRAGQSRAIANDR